MFISCTMHRMNDGLETHFLSSTFLQPVSHTQTLICQSRRWLTPTQTNPDIRVILITQATFLILYTNLIYTWFDLNTKHIWINSVEFRLNLKSISLTFVSNTVRMLCKILNTNKYKKTKQKKNRIWKTISSFWIWCWQDVSKTLEQENTPVLVLVPGGAFTY